MYREKKHSIQQTRYKLSFLWIMGFIDVLHNSMKNLLEDPSKYRPNWRANLMTLNDRQSIRRICLSDRKRLSNESQRDYSKTICNRIESLQQYQNATHIALYQSVNGEVDLSDLWNSAPSNEKNYYCPVMMKDLTLSFLPANPNSNFHINQFGIPEPEVDLSQVIPPDKLDLIIIPLVAFDQHGTRLGMGKGFYDRTLSKHRPKLLLGVAYEFQHQAFIEPQPWDVKLDAIVTEKTIYWSL